MCLKLYKKSPTVWKKDRKVYKVFFNYINYLTTPFQREHMHLGTTYNTNSDAEPEGSFIWGGFYHCCRDVTSAKNLIRSVTTYEDPLAVIAECIIPKGTPFYEGAESDLATKIIKVVRLLSNEEIEKKSNKECHYNLMWKKSRHYYFAFPITKFHATSLMRLNKTKKDFTMVDVNKIGTEFDIKPMSK